MVLSVLVVFMEMKIRIILHIFYSRSKSRMPKRRPSRRSPDVSWRKQPKQARSNELVATILEAAIQVLEREGAQRFTTIRVAEKAGVSIGSLYQYFPNKAAILFRLQSDEWKRTSDLLREILEDKSNPPFVRLRKLVHAFLRSECEEAGMRVSSRRRRAALPRHVRRRGRPWLKEIALSTPSCARRCLRPRSPCALWQATLLRQPLARSENVSRKLPEAPKEIEAYADAIADMFCAYLNALTQRLVKEARGTNRICCQ